MLRAKSAKRYARAFYELALESNKIDQLLKDFGLISQIVADSDELKNLLRVPIISNEERYKILVSIFENKVDKVTLKFLEFLVEKNRIALIEDVFADLVDLFNDDNNIQKIDVYSAFKLSDDELKSIEKKVEAKFSKKVISKMHILPELIGGFKIQLGDQVYDFSILSQLNELKNNFINVR